jgi:hypothetical protein
MGIHGHDYENEEDEKYREQPSGGHKKCIAYFRI